MNTPRVVLQESKKAFRAIFKRNDLEAAMGALSNLKGVGPAMASGSSSEPLKERGQAQTNGKENMCFVKTAGLATSCVWCVVHCIRLLNKTEHFLGFPIRH